MSNTVKKYGLQHLIQDSLTMEGRQDSVGALDISDRLRHLMTVYKLTVSELADAAGVSKSAMEKYLAGPSSPRATAIVSLCLSLGVNSEWLLFGRPDEDYRLLASEARHVISTILQEVKQDGPVRQRFDELELGTSEWRMFIFEFSDERALELVSMFSKARKKALADAAAGLRIAQGPLMPFKDGS